MKLKKCEAHYNTEFCVMCNFCNRKKLIEDCFANLKGKPFQSYYCRDCIELYKSEHILKQIDREGK